MHRPVEKPFVASVVNHKNPNIYSQGQGRGGCVQWLKGLPFPQYYITTLPVQYQSSVIKLSDSYSNILPEKRMLRNIGDAIS